MRTSRDRVPAILLIALLAVNFLALARKASDTLRVHGEAWEDPKVLLAGEAFVRDGFLAHRLTPFLQTTPLGETPEEFRFYYGRSQALCYLTNGLLRLAGIETLTGFRLVATFIYTLGLAAMWWFFRHFAPPWTALLATALAASFPPMYIMANSLAVHSYMPLFLFGPLALWLHAERNPESRRWTWPLLWLFLVLQFLFTQHTYAILFHLFAWGYMIRVEKSWRWKEAVLWLSASACATAFVLLRNAWLMGTDAAFHDAWTKLVWRMYGGDPTGTLPDAGWSVARGAMDMGMRLASNFGPAALAILLLAFLGRKALAEQSPALRAAGLLLGAGVLHAAVFFQAASIHYFTMRDFAPAAALLLAACSATAWRRAKEERAWWKAALCAALIAGIMGLSVRRCHRLETNDPARNLTQELRALEASLPPDAALLFEEFSPYHLYHLRRPLLSQSSVGQGGGDDPCGLAARWPGKRPFLVEARPGGGFALREIPCGDSAGGEHR